MGWVWGMGQGYRVAPVFIESGPCWSELFAVSKAAPELCCTCPPDMTSEPGQHLSQEGRSGRARS